MPVNPDCLFVYGTLRPPFANPFARFLRQCSQHVGAATFPGVLLDLGSPGVLSYPGAIYQPNATTDVAGTVYDISSYKEFVLAYLDEYEGVGEFDQPNEYIRTVIPVRCNGVVVDCWVYLYNHSADGKPIIASGDYVHYSRNE